MAGDTPQTPKPGVVIPHKPNGLQRTVAAFAHLLIRTVTATLRFKWSDRGGFFSNPPAPQAIYCIWHNRLALCMKAHVWIKKRNQSSGLAVMISASKDGAQLAAILEKFDVQPARGSSSRRGSQALRELTGWARKKYDLAITPDGPRGPCYVAQEGVISLAQLTGLPIVPVSFHVGWKIRLKSWDRFQIPLPFSSCAAVSGSPLYIPRDASPADREKFRQQLEDALKSLAPD